MELSYRSKDFGFPVRWPQESDLNFENEFLFGLYEWWFCRNLDTNRAKYFWRAYKMGFPNHVIDTVPEKKLSHDQSTAYFFYASVLELDNALKEIPYPDFHPRDYVYYAILQYPWLAFTIVPMFLLYIICAISFFIPIRYNHDKKRIEKKLSGELLWLLRIDSLICLGSLHALLAVPLFFISRIGAHFRYGGVKEMVFAYFNNDPKNPIIQNWNYDEYEVNESRQDNI